MIVYIAASAHDARFTRICVASTRTFYPDVDVRILPGGPLAPGLLSELREYWNVGAVDLPSGDYGWGFVKLEPLFSDRRERFLMLDSDTVMTGPVLDLAMTHTEEFVVDGEAHTKEQSAAIYYDYERAAAEGMTVREPAFLFNTGHWVGTSGVLCREDFRGLIRWEFPRTLTNPRVFKNGEQGLFNFVLNEHYLARRIRVARVPLMRWPGHGMDCLDADAVEKKASPALVVHWAGMKRARQRDMPGADLLAHFEEIYYARLPGGHLKRNVRGCRSALAHWCRPFGTRARQRVRKTLAVHRAA